MLSPIDVDNVRFRQALLGYDKRDVEQFLVQVSRAMEEYAQRERDTQRSYAGALREMERYRENEGLIKDSMVLAQRTADNLIAAAKEKAALAAQAAEIEQRQMQQELARLRAQREQFEFAFHGLLSGFISQLESANPALSRRPPTSVHGLPEPALLQILDVQSTPTQDAESAPQAPAPSVVSLPNYPTVFAPQPRGLNIAADDFAFISAVEAQSGSNASSLAAKPLVD